MHLTSIAKTFQQTKKNLLQALRKESQRAEQEIAFSSDSAAVAWAVIWQSQKRSSFSNAWQKLRERVAQFEMQMNALTPWTVLNQQLRSVGALCAKVSDTASAPTQVLSGLVDDFRERFATDFWGPLSAANEFSERLQAIQSELQALLYSYVRTFNRELEEVVAPHQIVVR
jgi:hypothetical protein